MKTSDTPITLNRRELNARERAAVEEARPCFQAARPHASNARGGPKRTYGGKTVDQVLKAYGIGYGYVRGDTTYATIINAIIDGDDWNNLPQRVAREKPWRSTR